MSQFLERLHRSEFGTEISQHDLGGLMVDTWGRDPSADEINEALRRLEGYTRAGLLPVHRTEQKPSVRLPLLGVIGPRGSRGLEPKTTFSTIHYYLKQDVQQALERTSDPALQIQGIIEWLGATVRPAPAHAIESELLAIDDKPIPRRRVIELFKYCCPGIKRLVDHPGEYRWLEGCYEKQGRNNLWHYAKLQKALRDQNLLNGAPLPLTSTQSPRSPWEGLQVYSGSSK